MAEWGGWGKGGNNSSWPNKYPQCGYAPTSVLAVTLGYMRKGKTVPTWNYKVNKMTKGRENALGQMGGPCKHKVFKAALVLFTGMDFIFPYS